MALVKEVSWLGDIDVRGATSTELAKGREGVSLVELAGESEPGGSFPDTSM